ncbi:MAG TPA: hypothetical protein VMV57_07125 [Terracidiphilus sp.]|nr:hypothetical protein [Terracidiphilus sp.]
MKLKPGPAVLAATAMCLGIPGAAQTVKVDQLTQAQLARKAQSLAAKAEAGDGSASIKLADYPNHFTMIAYREKSGGAEVHENFADFFLVVNGSATLITGGKVQNPRTTGLGEIRGTAVQGGTRQALKKGDVVHIPAGVSHQLLLPKGKTFSYFVIKVKEQELAPAR